MQTELEYVNTAAAEAINNQQTVVIEETTLDVGQFIPQGDVALIKLSSVPAYASRVDNPSPQIAPGNTQGSRHAWGSMEGVEVYDPHDSSPLVGQIYKLNKKRTLTHPEHGHHEYHAGFIGICRYQRAYAKELQRVQD